MGRVPFISVTKKDLEITTFRSSGPGGQHRNKTDTSVRIRHRASGAIGQATESKSQEVNKRAAFRRMANSPTFRQWLNDQARPTIEEVVAKQMEPQNLKIEVRRDDAWVEE